MALTTILPFANENNYSFDEDKIEIKAGKASLKSPASEDNPSLSPNSSFRVNVLQTFEEDATKPASTEIKYILGKNGTNYYWNGSAWVTSNGTYEQASTATEIDDNALTFNIGTSILLEIIILLHTEGGSPTPKLDSLTITYDYTNKIEVALEFTSVFGFHKDQDGNPLTMPIFIELEQEVVEYKDQVAIMRTKKTVTPDADGFWEVNLIETENMAGTQHYIFKFAGLQAVRQIPNLAAINFWDLTK